MKFNQLIKDAREELEQSKIKLQENMTYNGVIKSANLLVNDKNKEVVQLQIEIVSPEDVKGKMIKRVFLVDDSYSEQVRKISMIQIITLLKDLAGIELEENETNETFMIKLLKLNQKSIFIRMKRTPDKKDPSIIYTNYTIYTTPPQK